MRQAEPPSIASWMLEHMAPGPRNEALAGDLLEEFRSGRSAAWYWRQVLAAIAIGCFRDILNHVDVLVFTALWSMLAPAWLLAIASIEQHFNFGEHIWQMAWPWSTVCDLGVILGANLLFIWIGIVLYLIPHLWITGNLRIRPLSRGVLASLPVLIAVWAALIVLPIRFLAQTQPANRLAATPINTSAITHLDPVEVARIPPQETWYAKYGDKVIAPRHIPLSAIGDIRAIALIVRVPFFLCVLCTLWGATSRLQNRSKRISA